MSPPRPSRLIATALFTALLAVLLPAQSASAAEGVVSGGRLDWGVKSSFQTYVTGPIAKGSWNLSGGAGTIGENQFRFHSASGSYDPDNGSLRSSFAGGVRFVGHQKAGGEYELDLTISRPTVRVSGNSGTLHADIRSKAKGSGAFTERSQVALASLNLGGVDMRGGSSPIALSGVPATLTSEGAQSFAGYYTAGTPLDPVSLSVDVKSAAPTASPDGDDKKGDGSASDKPSEASSKTDFADAALDWGVRRTFREYVSGPIAEGEWKLAGGAKDGGALYRFPGSKGSYDAKKEELKVDFDGSVHFTGKEIDLKLSKVSVVVRDGKGTVSTDGTPLVTFAAPLKPKKDLILVEEAPAKLTEKGSKLFGSMYQKGTAMDPVTLAVALDKSAELPALPDLGSEASKSDTAAADDAKATKDKDAEETATENTSSGSAPPVLVLSMAAALLLAATTAFWFVRRRRTTTSPANSEE